MKATQEKYSNMTHPAPPRKTADLSTYIAEAVATVFGTRIDPIFSADPSERRPHLQKPGRNRIMIYPGCFNPPHRGHAAILNAAYEASHDLNVIAAIIVPAEEEVAGKKADAAENGTVLTKAGRAKLWQGDRRSQLWRWVYQYPATTTAWFAFRGHLAAAMAGDGFEVTFVTLLGPDHVRLNRSLPRGAWGSEELIVCDGGRPADFFTEEEGMKELKGCGPWYPVTWDREEHFCFVRGVVESYLAVSKKDSPDFFERQMEQGA